VDNIPGAPGIGDKGSVDLIQRFGTVEQALDRADEVEKKTYRESLQNNRDIVLFSKKMATIDTDVPMKLNTEEMRSSEPDAAALRALFAELEFNTLLRELIVEPEVREVRYSAAQGVGDVERILQAATKTGYLAVAVEGVKAVAEEVEVEEEKDDAQGTMLLLDAPELPAAAKRRIAISGQAGEAVAVGLSEDALSGKLRKALADAKTPKAIHDYKAALHACGPQGISLNGVQHDTLLYSYLCDPTYSSHTLSAVGLRRFNENLSGDLAESADVCGRATASLRKDNGITSIDGLIGCLRGGGRQVRRLSAD